MKSLAELTLNKPSKIISLIESELKLKLLEMGVIPGKEVTVLFKAPLGDPIAVEVSGYTLSLRLSEAQLVFVESC
ncbi:MAG TPA: ferrous iron transport protein A [Fluviicola sp.]|nr:ferrous iron transport protein A [Fluviicola sp.]